jgi:hypothetical protein
VQPSKKIELAIAKLERSRLALELHRDDLVGYELEYINIIDNLIAMMKSATKNTHWFKMTGDDSWDTKDRWKRDALYLANKLVEDEDDN